MIGRHSLPFAAILFLIWAPASGRSPDVPPAASHQPPAGVKANLDLPFDAGGGEEVDEEHVETVVFYLQQYEGDAFFFCCDRSGSMNEGRKFKRLQEEVIRSIRGFSSKVQFGIVFFDAGMTKFPNSNHPATATPTMKAAATALVMSSAPGHGTCAKPALLQSVAYAKQSTARRKVIIYLSDGVNTCPGHDPVAYTDEVLREVTAANARTARINTICIGPAAGVNPGFMRALASRNGGQSTTIGE